LPASCSTETLAGQGRAIADSRPNEPATESYPPSCRYAEICWRSSETAEEKKKTLFVEADNELGKQ